MIVLVLLTASAQAVILGSRVLNAHLPQIAADNAVATGDPGKEDAPLVDPKHLLQIWLGVLFFLRVHSEVLLHMTAE